MPRPGSSPSSRPARTTARSAQPWFLLALALLQIPLPAQQPLHGFVPRNTKGTNYFANLTSSFDNLLGSLPASGGQLAGQFDPALVNAEVGRAAASGLDSIRYFPCFYAWIADRQGFMNSLGQLAAICNQHGVKITYTLWSAIGMSRPALSADGVISPELWHELPGSLPGDPLNFQVYAGSIIRTILLNQEFLNLQGAFPPGEPSFFGVHVEPGNELIAQSGDYTAWPFGMAARIDAYLAEIATFFSSHPAGVQAFGSYDLFNEPNGGANTYNIPIANYIVFIKTTYDRVHAIHPNAQFTVGWAGSDAIVDVYEQALLAAGVQTTYYSVHSYAGGDIFERDVAARVQTARKRGVDLVCSEFYRTDFTAGGLAYQLAALRKLGAGGQMWGFIQGNTFNNYPPFGVHTLDGIYIPVANPAGPAPVLFLPNNPADRNAVEAWTAGTIATPEYTRLRILDQPEVLPAMDAVLHAGSTHTLAVTSSLTGQPVTLLRTDLSPVNIPCQPGAYHTCGLIPGIGPLLLTPQTTGQYLGVIPQSGVLLSPIHFDPSLAGMYVSLSAYVGIYPHHNFNQNTGELAESLLIMLL